MKKSTKPKALWVGIKGFIQPHGPVFEIRPEAIQSIYRAAAAAFKKLYPTCACCLHEKNHQPRDTHDVHHMSGRGPALMNPKTWLPVCRPHHDWIHRNTKEAVTKGYLNLSGWFYIQDHER